MSISSSLADGVEIPADFDASVSADPKALPNIEFPDGAGFSVSSFAEASGLKELSSLNGVEPNGLSVALSSFTAKGFGALLVVEGVELNGLAKGFSVFEANGFGVVVLAGVEPNGVTGGLLPLPKMPDPPELPAAAKPPWLAKLAKPPEDGAGLAGVDEVAAVPNGLWVFWLAKLPKPDLPKAGAADAPPADQGEVLMPKLDD